MKNNISLSYIMLIALMFFTGGCTNKYEALCDDLDKIVDPAQRARLSKECNLPMTMQDTSEPISQNTNPVSPQVEPPQKSFNNSSMPKKRHSGFKKSTAISWGPDGRHP